MVRFIVRRLLLLVPILIGVSILVFVWIRALPGSPAESLLGERATPATIERLRQEYGLNQSVFIQYEKYMETTLKGDFGYSIASRRPVTEELRHRFPATVELALAAMFFAILFGVPLGFFAAKRYGSFVDHGSLFLSLIGISIPIFFLGLILKYVFAVKLGWLPSVGQIDVTKNVKHSTNFYVLDAIITHDWGTLADVLKHLVLPAVALGTVPLAIVARITRAAVLDVQNEDYVRTARAKGLSPRIVDRRHVFRNALLPLSTVIGLQVGLLLSGAILTETVFAWPGVGIWLADAISARDYPVLQAGILFLAIVFVLVNLIVDISYAIINPRIRYS